MKFRTEVTVEPSEIKIQPDSKIFTIGSCFSSELSQLLGKGQLQTLDNPFGTIFNPFSIATAVGRMHSNATYTIDDLIIYNGKFISLDHHTRFDSEFAHKSLEKINAGLEEGNLFLQTADWIVITLGTAFIYEFLPKERWVANCHKIPGKFFTKKLLTQDEIKNSIEKIILFLKDICPENAQILFTVSPVRHTKDGMSENSLSKANLLTALHQVLLEFDNCRYLPVFEMMMDDLRDYRFYRDDLIHPNSQAINYIFENFGNAYFSEETMDFIEENFRISNALAHKSTDAESSKHQEFLDSLQSRIDKQQEKVKHKIFS